MKLFKALIVTSLYIASCSAYFSASSYGSSGAGSSGAGSSGGGADYGGGSTSGSSGISFSGPASGGSSSGGGGVRYLAAVMTKHSVETRPVQSTSEISEPAIIEVEGNELPLEIHFKSSSSRIKLRQSHSGGGRGQMEQTSSDEEPNILRHTVRKPIIQEVREIITPYRRVIQEIHPVQEEIQTIVSRANEGGSSVGGSANRGGSPGGISAGPAIGSPSGPGRNVGSRGGGGLVGGSSRGGSALGGSALGGSALGGTALGYILMTGGAGGTGGGGALASSSPKGY